MYLIKKNLLAIVFIAFGFLNNTNAQSWLSPESTDPPSNLTYNISGDNDVNLFWDQPTSGGDDWIHWDSGDNADAYGFMMGAEHFAVSAKWDPAHLSAYDTWTITKMRFFVTSDQPTITLKIWTGTGPTEIYSQDISTYNINGWTEIILDTPVTIDASTQLWAGLDIDMPTSDMVMGMDAGPGITGYGDMLRYQGTWYTGADLGIDNNWNIQIYAEESSAPSFLHWDSGSNADAFGFMMGAEHFAVSAKWDPSHLTAYDGLNITMLRFYVVSDQPTITLKIWTGTGPTEIYSQDISTYNTNDWTEITLDTPIPIDASTQLWAGLDIDMPTSSMVMGMDAGPGITGYGDMLRYQGTWYTGYDLGIDNNWNIQIQIGGAGKSTNDFLGYNIYRDDVVLNADPIANTAYIDYDLNNGIYNYYVTAIYDEGESTPTNTVEVTIAQTGILEADSLALVDLYNNCNGSNWNNQDQWLTGPVSSWQGVVTTDTRVTNLTLSTNNMSGDVPESFGNLTALESLYFTTNSITSLPESFGNLVLLDTFWIGWNESLTSLPESFGNLISLVQLHLGSTNLGTLPTNFGNLQNLEWLALGDAGLTSLPDSFGGLTSLTSCFIWGNNLTELPAGFGGMESLFYLSLSQNQLTTLPESFGDLDNLSFLYIEENQLSSLPESFGDLATLDSLFLSQNQLTSLPESFGDLADLSFVRLSINNLTSFPASISNLATIQVIEADQNQIESLPDNIGNLGNTLHLLGLSFNNISSLPSSIGDLDMLYEFYITDNQIESLPEEIGDMEILEVLALDDNQLVSLPESLINISSLGYLGVIDNNITSLPASFGDIAADTLLMSGNNLKSIPASMFEKDFAYLWLDANILQFGSLEPFVGQVAYGFLYDSQGKFSNDTLIDINQHENLAYTIDVSGDNNTYQWYKDGNQMDDQTTNTLNISDVSTDDLGIYVLKVNNTLITDLELTSYDVELNMISGIDQMSSTEFSLYPNPNKGSNLQIILSSSIGSTELQIHNTAGQSVLNQPLSESITAVNLLGLEKGLYLVAVLFADGSRQVKKLIID